MKILIVEDNEKWRNYLTESLQDDGHSVKSVRDLTSAREEINSSYKILILDLNLDETEKILLEGQQLLEFVKRKYPRIVCFVVSGSELSRSEVRDLFVDYKANDYFFKGDFRLNQFLSAVKESEENDADKHSQRHSHDDERTKGFDRIPDSENLLDLIDRSFDLREFRELCYFLEVDFDRLAGEEKRGKIRELILYFKRRDDLSKLIEKCETLRPGKQWTID